MKTKVKVAKPKSSAKKVVAKKTVTKKKTVAKYAKGGCSSKKYELGGMTESLLDKKPKKDRDPLRQGASCRSGNCAPGLRGKNPRKGYADFSKRKFKRNF
jgi:hypothetical protein